MKYKDKIVVQTYVPLDIYNKLKEQAEKEKRTLSSYLRIILEDTLSKQEVSSNETIHRNNE